MKSSTFNHREPRKWLQASLTLADNQVELATAALAEITDSGIEQDSTSTNDPVNTERLTAYLSVDEHLDNNKVKIDKLIHLLNQLRHDNEPAPSLTWSELTEEDWGKNWKEHFKPLTVCPGITIIPSWENYQGQKNEIIIKIDPGMAFGTGHHASTKLALTLIARSFKDINPKRVLDVGTGTGILGIGCALMGADEIIGIDNDPDAIAIARDNLAMNNTRAMTISQATLAQLSGPFDLIAANITQEVILEMASQLVPLLAKKGHLILAGILQGHQASKVKQAFQDLGLELLEEEIEGEWQALLYTHKIKNYL